MKGRGPSAEGEAREATGEAKAGGSRRGENTARSRAKVRGQGARLTWCTIWEWVS